MKTIELVKKRLEKDLETFKDRQGNCKVQWKTNGQRGRIAKGLQTKIDYVESLLGWIGEGDEKI